MPITDHPSYDTIMLSITQLISDVSIAQTAYFSAHGKYFQGIKTPTAQLDGITEGTLDVDVKPLDQSESWIDFAPTIFQRNSKIPYQISIDVYETFEGWGWIMTFELWYLGTHYVYHHYEGITPAIFNTFDEWIII